jgi:hypothetical protein
MRSVLAFEFGGIDDGFCYRVCVIGWSRYHVRYGICSYVWRGPGGCFCLLAILFWLWSALDLCSSNVPLHIEVQL